MENNNDARPLIKVVSCSYDHRKDADGGHRFYIYAIGQLANGQVMGLGHLEVEVNDLEVAKILCRGYADAIAQQPVDIVRP